MKLIRTASIIAGLLLAVASVSTTACDKKDDAKKKTTKPDPKKDPKKAPTPDPKTTAKTVAKDPAKTPTKVDPPAAATGDGFAIKIKRAYTVGTKYKFESTGKRDMKIMAAGKPAPGSGVMEWSYEAEVTIKAVSAKGEPTAEDHKVIKLEITLNGTKSTPVAKDKIIVASIKAGKEAFELDGAAAPREVAGVMGEIVSLDDGKGLDEDAVFGTKDKKKVGDSWDVDGKALATSWANDFKDAAKPLKAENVSGKVTLLSANDADGVKALQFKVEVTVKDVAPKMGPVQATGGSMTITMNGWLPQDASSVASIGGSKSLVMHVEGTVGPQTIVVDMKQEATEKKVVLK